MCLPPHRPSPRTLTLAGGLRLCIRAVTPEDRQRLLDGLRSITEETSYHRFFTPAFYPSEAELRYLTEVDYEQHVAVGAVDCTRDGEPGIGVARYIRLDDVPSVAEAAVLVVDAYQRRGIGSLLLAALSRYAAAHGVHRFRAYVLQENEPFLDYLRELGAGNEYTRDGIVQVDLPVYTDPESVPDTSATARARWAWQQLDEAREGGC
jgi:RimJ/RimL family protein N-acetyltransferase